MRFLAFIFLFSCTLETSEKYYEKDSLNNRTYRLYLAPDQTGNTTKINDSVKIIINDTSIIIYDFKNNKILNYADR